MNVLDLFSGIGGFSLGLERAGMRTVAFCERDEYCRAVLRKHWPHVPCFEDIHAIDADGLDRLGRIDLVCGGFPCQPFSVAGKQRAQADNRHLWPEMRRVIALARPAWVIGENVAGLITLGLDDVLVDLECLGYTARTFVIPAAAVGAPHRRDRLWIIATNAYSNGIREQSGWRDGANREGPAQPNIHGSAGPASNADGSRQPEHGERNSRPQAWLEGALRNNAGGRGEADVADASGEGLSISERSQLSRERRRKERGTAPQCSWWSTEPDVGRVANGVPRRVDRLKCLGNAVVPQVVEEIGRAIMLSV